MNNIPRFCDFGISSTFDAVLRYLPIFLRYYGICRYFLRYCGVRHPPMSPPPFLGCAFTGTPVVYKTVSSHRGRHWIKKTKTPQLQVIVKYIDHFTDMPAMLKSIVSNSEDIVDITYCH